MHILYVTPDLSDADLAQRQLERTSPGLRVDPCATPKEARTRSAAIAYDAIVVDAALQGRDGLQLVADVRARLPGCRVVVLTRAAGEEDAAMARGAGATECLEKHGNWMPQLAELLAGLQSEARPLAPPEHRGPLVDSAPVAAAPPIPTRTELLAQLAALRLRLEEETGARLAAEGRVAQMAQAYEVEQQRWQAGLRQFEDRFAAVAADQARAADLEASVTAAEGRYLELLEERRQQARRIELLEEQAARQRETIEEVATDRARIARELSDTLAEHARVVAAREGRIAALEQQYEKLARSTQQFEPRVAELRAELERVREHARGLSSQDEARRRELERLLTERVQVGRAAAVAEQQRDDAVARLVEASTALAAVRDDLRRAERRITEAVDERVRAEAAAAQLTARLSSIERESQGQVARRGVEVESLGARLETATRLLAEAETRVASLASDLATARRVGDDAVARAEALDRQLSAAQGVLDERDAQLRTLAADLDSARGALGERDNRERELASELESALALVEDGHRELRDLRDVAEAARAAANERDERVRAVAGELDAVRGALQGRDDQLQALAAEFESAQAVVEESHRQLSEARAAMEAARATSDARSETLGALETELQAAHAALRERDETVQALQEELEAVRAAASGREQEAAAIAAEHDRLWAEHAERKRTAESLAQELDAARAAAAEREQQVAVLTEALAQLRAQRDERSDDSEGLRRDLEAARATTDERERRVLALVAELDAARGALQDRDDRLRSVEGELEGARREIHDREDRLRSLESELEGSRAAVSSREQEIAPLVDELARLHAERDRDALRVDGLIQELDAARAAASEHEGHAAALADELATIRAELERRTSELERRAGTVEQLTRDLEAARLDVQRRDEELAVLGSELVRQRADLEARAGQSDALRGELDLARAEIEDRDRQLSTVVHEVALARGAVAEREARLQALHARMEEVETDQDAALARVVAELDEARAALAQARHLADEQQAALRALQEGAVVVAEEQQALRRTLAAELDVTRDARDAVLAQLVEAERARDEHAERVGQLSFEIAEIQRARDEHAARVEQLTSEISEAQQARNEALSELSRTRAAFDALTSARAALEQRVADLSAREAGAANELARMRESAGSLIAESEALRSAAEGIESLRAALSRDLEETRATLAAEREQREELQVRLTATVAQLGDEHGVALALEAELTAARRAEADAAAAIRAAEGRFGDELTLVQDELAALRAQASQSAERWDSERARLDALVADLTAQQRQLGDLGLIGLATTTGHGVVVQANDAFARLCGFETASALLSGDVPYALPFFGNRSDVMQRLTQERTVVSVDACLRHPDGRLGWLLALGRVRAQAGGDMAAVEWVALDATDRHLRLRQLRQARRLESARELATSAGQELVTLMSRLDAAARRVLAHAALSVAARSDAKELEATSARAATLLRQILAFAQKQARVSQTVDLDAALAHLLPTLRRLIGDEVTLDVERGRHGVLVDMDLRDFDQVVTNAVLALRDALPSGGLLTIATATIDASAAEADGRRVTPMALLIAAASGFGVREIAVPRALEETVGQQGGRLRVAHEPGRAVRLEICFALVCASRVTDVPPADVGSEAPETRSGSQWP